MEEVVIVLIKGKVGVVVVNGESALYLHSGSFKVPGRLLTRWRKLHSTTNKIIWGVINRERGLGVHGGGLLT